jgi:hypothetical protein
VILACDGAVLARGEVPVNWPSSRIAFLPNGTGPAWTGPASRVTIVYCAPRVA